MLETQTLSLFPAYVRHADPLYFQSSIKNKVKRKNSFRAKVPKPIEHERLQPLHPFNTAIQIIAGMCMLFDKNLIRFCFSDNCNM